MHREIIRLVGDRLRLIHSVHLPSNRCCKRGELRKKPFGFVQSKYSNSSFLVTIFTVTFRFKAQQLNHHNLKFLHDLTKNFKRCTKLKYFYVHFQRRASPLRQREVNQNSQTDQSQAGIDVNRHQADQVNALITAVV